MHEMHDFQGTWRALLLVDDGRRRNAEELKRTSVTITGDRYTLRRGDFAFDGVITGIDPTRNHGAVDFVADGRDGTSRRSLGLYVLEDDELTVCVAAPGQARPTSFAPRRGDGHCLYLLKRCAPYEGHPVEQVLHLAGVQSG
jgi:uncharacterized protein (TIGR03067 family)